MRRLRSNVHNLGIALAFALIAALAWQAKRTQDALMQANASVARSLEVITAIQGTLSALLDIETGMRGYVLTGTEAFLEPYHRGRGALVRQRELLGARLGDTAAHAAWLRQLDQVIGHRVALATGNVEFRRSGSLEAAVLRMRTGAGKQAMDRARALLGEMEAAERQALERERRAIGEQLERGRRQALLGGVIAVTLLLVALVSVNRSLVQRARLAARAQAGEARQRAMLQALPDTLWQVADDGRLQPLSVDSAATATLPPGLAEAITARLPQAQPDTDVQTFPWQDADGREFEVRLVSAAGGDRLAIVRDVTDAARNRRDLLDRRAFLRNIVDTDENLIFVRDADGRFVLCNVAFCDVLHLDPSQLEGESPHVLAGHARIAPLLEGDEALVAGETEWRHEQVRVVDAAGVERWLQVLKRPLELSRGRQVLTVAVDITARLRMERLKSEFISTVSHELRTPLTSIRGALGMLTGEVPAAAQPLLAIAHKNTERLVRLINDLLDIEKLQSGGLQLHLRVLPLRALVAQSIADNGTYAQQFGVQVALAPGEDGEVEVDPDRFAQVMANLLSNAIKHSPPQGTVHVRIDARYSGWRITVADQGAGIPMDFQPRVFERFAQADSSDVRRLGGSGLGLAITRSLVEQMQGTVSFDSTPGEGTQFYVWLPQAAQASLPGPARRADAPSRPRIVLLEGDIATANTLESMLASQGCDVTSVLRVEQARALLDAGGVSALAIDLALPGDAGPALLRELRAQPRFRHLPVLVLGVQPPASNSTDGLRGGTVGVVDWLGKPLDAAQVAAAVRSCLHGAQGQRQVLHVEDDAALRTRVRQLLSDQALTLHEAADLATARRELAARHHDLLILDLMLPDGDSAQLLPELGAAQPPSPVILCSAQDTVLPDSRIVLRRLAKSRSDAAELASLILLNLTHWPVGGPGAEDRP